MAASTTAVLTDFDLQSAGPFLEALCGDGESIRTGAHGAEVKGTDGGRLCAYHDTGGRVGERDFRVWNYSAASIRDGSADDADPGLGGQRQCG